MSQSASDCVTKASPRRETVFKTTSAETPAEYIDMLEEPRKSDIRALDALIRRLAPQLEPHLASGMLAYGRYHYKGKSKGTEGEWFHIGLASNKNYISLYVMAADKDGYLAESYKDKLPKANIGRSCVRFKRLSDLDQKALNELITTGAKWAPIGLSG
jgi:hypothetical protein